MIFTAVSENNGLVSSSPSAGYGHAVGGVSWMIFAVLIVVVVVVGMAAWFALGRRNRD